MNRRVAAVLLLVLTVGAAVGYTGGIRHPNARSLTPASRLGSGSAGSLAQPTIAALAAASTTGAPDPRAGGELQVAGPPPTSVANYRSPSLTAPLPDLDPGLRRRGPRPTLGMLGHDYQYGNPAVMFGSGAPGDWRLGHPAPGAVRGYAGDVSVTPGSSLPIMLAGADPWTDLEVFRVGRGDAQLVARIPHVTIPRTVEAAPDPTTGLVEEQWPVAARLSIGSDWSSGVYLVRLTGASGGQSYLLFVVRAVHPGPLTFVLPTMTYAAYNGYGGADLYGWSGGPHPRAYAVSFDRPFDHQFGAGQLFRLDFPLIVWLEDHGYAPDYVTDVDVARDPTLLQGVHTLLFSGHGEYWTRGMRDTVEAASASGTNLAFFGANQAFWQSRLTPDSSGAPDRTLVCYKSAALDPVAATDPGGATVRFEDPPVNRPPMALIGQKYGGILRSLQPMTVGAGMQTFAPDLALRAGMRFPGLVGEEVDELHRAFDGLVLGSTVASVVEHPGRITVGTTVWITPSGNRVFDAGTFDYSWGLDPRYAGALPGFDAVRFTELTARILAWLGAAPTT